jgi:hypothetical protein
MNIRNSKRAYLLLFTTLILVAIKKSYAAYNLSTEEALSGLLFSINFILNLFMLAFLVFLTNRKPSIFFFVVSLISFYMGYKFILEAIEENPGQIEGNKYIFSEIILWLLGFCSLYLWVTRRFSIERSLQKALNIRFFILSIFQMLILDLFPSSDQRYFETFLFVCLVIPIQNLIGAIYRNLIVTSISFIVSGLLILRFSPYFSKNISFDMQSFLPVLFILIVKYIYDIIMDLKYKIQIKKNE